MAILKTLFGMEIIMWLIIFVSVRKKYAAFIKHDSLDLPFDFMAPVSLYLLDRIKFIERLGRKWKPKITEIYGSKGGQELTRRYLAQTITYMILVLLMTTFISILTAADYAFLLEGSLLLFLIPVLMQWELDKKVKKRKQEILIELPELVNKILLLVNAGETIQKAITRCAPLTEGGNETPLYRESRQAVYELENRCSFPQVMEDFSKRCAVQEVSLLTTTVLLNYRRGGDEMVFALRGLSQSLWERRKSLAKTLGEEASSKLVFPMVLIFVVVMMIVASPAIMILNQ